jgi:hypothetical protein
MKYEPAGSTSAPKESIRPKSRAEGLGPEDDATLLANASKDVKSAIMSASDVVGVNADYMLRLIKRESNFNPKAFNKSKLSSAEGLGQFINSTWDQMFSKYGSELGYNTTKMSQSDIRKLKFDATVSSFMAAKYTKENADSLKRYLGTTPTGKDLYLAHFMGLGGAKKFLKGKLLDGSSPASTVASDIVMNANPSIFYVGGKRNLGVRSIDTVYNLLTGEFK